jgi:hypothetical protein
MRNRIIIFLTIISVILIAIFVIPALDLPGGPNLIRNPSFEKPPPSSSTTPTNGSTRTATARSFAAAPARWTTADFQGRLGTEL